MDSLTMGDRQTLGRKHSSAYSWKISQEALEQEEDEHESEGWISIYIAILTTYFQTPKRVSCNEALWHYSPQTVRTGGTLSKHTVIRPFASGPRHEWYWKQEHGSSLSLQWTFSAGGFRIIFSLWENQFLKSTYLFVYYLLTYLCEYSGSQRTVCRSWFSTSIVWALVIKLRSSSLMSSVLTSASSLWLSHFFFIVYCYYSSSLLLKIEFPNEPNL